MAPYGCTFRPHARAKLRGLHRGTMRTDMCPVRRFATQIALVFKTWSQMAVPKADGEYYLEHMCSQRLHGYWWSRKEEGISCRVVEVAMLLKDYSAV
jgi:hypothetical protein